MNERAAPLDDLRREIDNTDDAIHDLVMRRFELTARVLAAKSGAGAPLPLDQAMRPGREAQIVRRLVKRHAGVLPIEVIGNLWREIIAASLMAQSPFAVEVFGGENRLRVWNLARAHFGGATRMRARDSAKEALRNLSEGECAFAVMPMPKSGEADPWWVHLSTLSESAPRIVARLPFVGAADAEAALVVASIAPDQSGDDVSLFTIQADGALSRDSLGRWLEKAAPKGTWLSSVRPVGGGTVLHLIALDGYLDASAPLFAELSRFGEGAIRQVTPIGAYARPIAAQ